MQHVLRWCAGDCRRRARGCSHPAWYRGLHIRESLSEGLEYAFVDSEFSLQRRRTNSQRFGNKRNPFATDKGYRISATRLTDETGAAYAGGGVQGYRDDPFDDRAPADAYPLDPMTEKTGQFFPGGYGNGVGRTPSISSGAGMAGRGIAGGYAAFGAPGGAYGSGEVTPVVVQHASGTEMMPVPAIAVTHANAPRTRDLTNVGPYARSERAFVQDLPSAQPYGQGPYHDDSDPGHADLRSPSPTDYYGQAMTPQATDAFINERYAEETRGPAQNPFLIGDEEERLEEQQQRRSGTKTPRQSMPQLPPLSPGVFDSPLTSNFGAFAATVPPAQLQPPSRSPSQKRSAEELKRGYADLAKAAQIDEPVTPVNAAGQGSQIPPAGQPNLMPPVERYQHGRPLSPLDEFETPVATPSTGQPAHYFAGASPAGSAARPYTPENRVYGIAHGSPGSESLAPHSGVPPSLAYPPPSPGVSLPESPSGSFLGHADSAASTPPRRPFRPADAQSTVSLDAAYADHAQGYRFSAGAWDSPASTRTMPPNQQQYALGPAPIGTGLQTPLQPTRYGYSVQQGASRRSVGPDDAYGGI